MKNFKSSDYALNKHSKGIVYRSANGRRTVVTEDVYLAENPGKTPEDFKALKKFSDADYLKQDCAEYNETYKNVSGYRLENEADISERPIDEAFLDSLDLTAAKKAFAALMADEALTETRRRRFLLHVRDGLSLRQIAEREGVTLRAVAKSVKTGEDTLKKYFQKFL